MALLPSGLFRACSRNLALLNFAQVRRTSSGLTRASCRELPVFEQRPLVLKASEFQHLFEQGQTQKAYAHTPVRCFSQPQQGQLLQEWAAKVLQRQHPEAEILDPEPGTCCNGSRRGRHQAEYDFLMGGPRVEVKSSRMVWGKKQRHWLIQFANVKLPHANRSEPTFDDLYLVIMTPNGLI